MICDCHIHLYEDHYPLAASATFKPPVAPVSAYREVQKALGLQRVILVQPTGYGFDNRCLLDGLGQFGFDVARGIVVVKPDTSDAELRRLHDQGVRGVRFMMLAGAGGLLDWAALDAFAPRLAALGWCANLQLDGRDFPRYKAQIDRLPCTVVIDHIGKFLEPVAVDHPAFLALLDILARPNRWVKLSGAYETSKVGPPHYADVSVLAKYLAALYPERCLWASNWPHPNRNPLPSNVQLLSLLDEWAPDADVRQKILVDNPARLYGF